MKIAFVAVIFIYRKLNRRHGIIVSRSVNRCTGGLVDNQQILILKKHFKRQFSASLRTKAYRRRYNISFRGADV